MATVLDSLPRGSRAAIVRLRSLGDCVLTTPAIDILKRARPDLRLAIVVEDRFRPVFEDNPDVDALLPPRLAPLRAWKPALCLNFHGGGTSARLTALSGARFRAGFGHFRFRAVYNVRIPRAQEILGEERKVHTAEHLASAIFYLGAARVEIPRARLTAPPADISRPYAVLHPVASHPAKTWPAPGFVAVAEHLERALSLEPVFVGGPGDDLSPFSRFRVMAGAPLGQIKSLMARATLFVGNDSGPAHIAAAFGVPMAVIFGDSDHTVWYPWRTPSEVLRSPEGIGSVPVQRVLEALERLRVRV